MGGLLPLIAEPAELETLLDNPDLTIVDLSKAENYNKYHIPGSLLVDYASVVRTEKPVLGLIPDADSLSRLMSTLGIHKQQHVIAYDDEGGGKAARFLWTLEVHGHTRFSLLNGGIFSWSNEGYPLTDQISGAPEHTTYPLEFDAAKVSDKAYVRSKLGDANTVLLDTRTPEEFSGIKKFAERGGHIPGAINYNWTNAMDQENNLRLLSAERLLEQFNSLEITQDKEIIAYCQTHHRSSHTFYVLKSLGYTRLKGYPGAWSDWGNDPDTPVEM